MHLRCANEAGVDAAGLRAIASGNARQILTGAEVTAIPAPRGAVTPLDPDLERAYTHLISAFGCSNGGADPSEQVALARLACRAEHSPQAELLGQLNRLLERLEREFLPAARTDPRYGPLERLLVAAITLARTPAASGL